MRTNRWLPAALAPLALTAVASAQLDDPIPGPIPKGITIDLQTIATGLTAPLWLTHAGDGSGRLFIVDQAGKVQIIAGGVVQPTPFLDASSLLPRLGIFGTGDEFDFDERGLLGLAFHTGYADPASPGFGRLYTYTSEPVEGPGDFTTPDGPPPGESWSHQNVVREWRVDPKDPNRVDPGSSRVLYRENHPQFNHNAGWLGFGPDGMLYIADGDGGGADDENGQPWIVGEVWGHGEEGNGQNLNVVLGKILRIDPLGSNSLNGQYGIPDDNPLVGREGLDEIYAWGLRNPYRASFDSTGRLVLGDVGQNDIEEVNIIVSGGNYGWRLKEGTFKFEPNGPGDGYVTDDLSGLPEGLIDPVIQYDHDEGLAIVGGFVYEGSLIPELQGMYVFGEFSRDFISPQGRLFYGDLDTGEIFEFAIGLDDLPLGLFVKGMGRDAEGELYLLASTALGPFGETGVVLRLVPAPGAWPVLALLALGAARRRRGG